MRSSHGQAQQIAPRVRKGKSEERHRLNVGHHIVAEILSRQHSARFAGSQRLCGKNHNGPPLGRRLNTGHMHLSALAGCGHKAAQPTGGCIVWMAFKRSQPLPESAPNSTPAFQNAPPVRSRPAVPAADEPHPMPSGISLAMRIASGITGRPLLSQQAPCRPPE
jgi:hypothetical protein